MWHSKNKKRERGREITLIFNLFCLNEWSKSSSSSFSLFFTSNYCCQFLFTVIVVTFYYYFYCLCFFYYLCFIYASRNSYLLFKCYYFIFPFFSVLQFSSIGIHWLNTFYFVFLNILFHSQQTAISPDNDKVTVTFWYKNNTQWGSKLLNLR